MPVISGPVEVLIVSLALVAALAVWLLRRRRYKGPKLLDEDDGIDREELEAAEREVRDLDADHSPDDGFEGDDWGPGTYRRPRPPVRL